MKIGITPPRRLNDVSYAFNVLFDDSILIPGFRIYSGKLQAPMHKKAGTWYPMMYLDLEIAKMLHDAIRTCSPEIPLSEFGKATNDLILDSAIRQRFGAE